MFIVDGTLNGKRLPERQCFILTTPYGETDDKLFSSDYGYIALKNNIVSVDVVAQEQATGGGVQGAAGGAVLGFLIAGPIGTVLGAGMGSKKKGMDNTMIAISFTNGDSWVVDMVDAKELGVLKRYMATTKISQQKKISSPSKKRKTQKQKSTAGLKIKKPTKPDADPYYLKLYKGKKANEKTTLPNMPSVSEFKNLEGNEEIIKIFNKNFTQSLEEYNNFKWKYSNLKIESDKEVALIAQGVLKNLIIYINNSLKVKDNRKEFEDNIKDLEDHIKVSKSDLQDKSKSLLDAGFLKKGGIKKEIKIIELDIKQSKSALSKKKRSLTSNKKKLDSHKEIRGIEDPAEKVVSIYSQAFPNEKKPSKNLKTKKSIEQFCLDIYRKLFDELWDEKIEEERRILKEKNKKKEAEKIKNDKAIKPEKSTKEKLLELKSLLDEELITKEEYDESRKKLLDSF